MLMRTRGGLLGLDFLQPERKVHRRQVSTRSSVCPSTTSLSRGTSPSTALSLDIILQNHGLLNPSVMITIWVSKNTSLARTMLGVHCRTHTHRRWQLQSRGSLQELGLLSKDSMKLETG